MVVLTLETVHLLQSIILKLQCYAPYLSQNILTTDKAKAICY